MLYIEIECEEVNKISTENLRGTSKLRVELYKANIDDLLDQIGKEICIEHFNLKEIQYE